MFVTFYDFFEQQNPVQVLFKINVEVTAWLSTETRGQNMWLVEGTNAQATMLD